MSGLVVANARVATADGLVAPGWLATLGRTIAGYGSGQAPEALAEDRTVVDAGGGWLLPGFVDVHVHGADGNETMDADAEGLDRMSSFYAGHGVTAFTPTTWTSSTADTLAALDSVGRVVGETLSGARVLGAHMEGPYLSVRRCGAQDEAHIRAADPAEAARFLDTGLVRLMTIAPEVGDNLWLVGECARRGVTACVGHTDATFEQVERAVAAGVRHATHVFNAMRPLHHREPGAVGAAMALPQIACELIADGVHVHPAAMRVLYAAKGPDGLLLVTDAMRAAGLADGTYAIGGRRVHVDAGAVRLDNGSLAGSVLTMDVALRSLVHATGLTPGQLWPVTSRTAARAAGVGDRKGTIADGMDADLVLLDPDLEVTLTVVEGRVVHRADVAPLASAEAKEKP